MKCINFETNLENCNSLLSRLCIRLCKNRTDAEDLYQETVYYAFKHYDKYKHDLPFDRWIYTLCINVFRNQYRKQKHSPQPYNFHSNEQKDELLANLPDCSGSIEEYNDLREIIDTLDYNKRIVIVLYYFHDLSIKEIGKMLSAPEGTVKKRLFAARKLIKERMNDNE